MSIIKWTPFLDTFDEMEKFFADRGPEGFAPAIDVYETKESVVVKTLLAGIDPKNVELSIENDVLTIKGETSKESEVDEKNYYRKEIRSGSFFRSVSLPAHVSSDKAEAEFKDGMLNITIPKAEQPKSKTITIKSA